MSKDTQQAALQQYLNSLLDNSESGFLQPSVEPAAKPVVTLLDTPLPELVLPSVMPRAPLISDAELERLPVSVTVAETLQDVILPVEQPVLVEKTLQQVTWSDEPFECLLFDVAGLTLAVPLAALGSIYAFKPAELTPLFAQPDWFIGILPAQDGSLKVLETARWVMPERYTADMRDDLKYVISINGFDWGLAVHQVRHSIRLEPHQVKWRTQRGQRAWLAGTVIEHMCALLDVEVLAKLISEPATKNQAHN
ncbi:MAG: chemotaxis protein CheW [Pseudomonas sp.]|jgi:purine-binding chemotaxis protein CheW|nr:chemotaxis protein CheW [Pseudomonas sp.]